MFVGGQAVAVELEVVVDMAVGGEEALGMAGRLEPLHLPLWWSGGLVRHLDAVVEVAALPVLDAGQDLTLCGGVAPELVGDHHPWRVLQSLEQLAEEPFGGLCAAPALHEDVEQMAVLVDCTPETMQLAPDADEHLVHEPFVARLRPAPLQRIGEQLAKA